MAATRTGRRRFLLQLAGMALGAPLLAACQQEPQIVERVVTQVVEKQVTQVVEREKIVTQVVTATPSPRNYELMWHQYTNWKGRTGTETDGKPEDYLIWQAEEFNRLHPNVTIKWENGVDPRKIDGSVAVGKPIHVASFNGQDVARYALVGALSPTDDVVTPEDRADFLPNPLQEMEIAGKHYGYPYRLSAGGGFLANVDVLKERGIAKLAETSADVRAPKAFGWTTSEYLDAMKAGTFSKTAGGQIDFYGVVLSGEYTHLLNQYLISYGARLWNEDLTKITLNNDAGVEALTWLADLELASKVAAPGTAGRSVQSSVTFFQNGQAGNVPVELGYHWKLLETQAKQNKWEKPFTIWGALPPHKPPARPLVQTNVFGYSVFKQKDKDEEAWGHRFAQFLADKERSMNFLRNGFPPTRKSLLEQTREDPILTVVTDVASANFHTFGRLARAAGPDPEMYQQVFSGKQTPKQAIAEYEARGNKKLEENLRLVEEAKKRGSY